MIVAKVAIDHASYSYDKLYDYLIPEGVTIAAGMRVVVPFGRGGDRMGFVVETGESDGSSVRLKAVRAVSDPAPVLGEELLLLLRWLKENTFCTWFDALRVLLPAGLGQRLDVGYTLTCETPLQPLTEREAAVLSYFKGKKKPVTATQLENSYPDSGTLLAALAEKGALQEEQLVLRRVQDQTITMVRLLDGWEGTLLTPKQQAAAEILAGSGDCSVKELCYFAGVTKGVVDKLVQSGAAEYYAEESYRDPYSETDRTADAVRSPLTDEQKTAADSLWAQYQKGTGGGALLYGITGSGKTQVFLELCDRVVTSGRQVIVLVPEISLTPQTIEKFHGYYGQRVAVLHSSLSLTERLDEWKRISRGLVDVVVGTRSAVFAPLPALGLIVIDEEQEHTYKSESAPRFDAREVARVRMRYHKGLLLLASATPSVESYHKATTGEYALVTLTQRYGTARLPHVTILDMGSEQSSSEGLSQHLCEEILYNLEHGEQTILLMNRRGHSTQVKCMSCHKPAECPNCSISLKYHAANNRLICHYCGYSIPVPTACPDCGSEYIRFSGLGTQKVEEEVSQRFPDARILRMDMDTTMRKFSHERLFADFRDQKYDIMVGTQMVAKGLNFPNVTLVGVLGVDQYLYSEDFRSFERTFSLVTQVVGRSGRNEKPGRAFLQTYTPENPILLAAAQQQYEQFFHDEIYTRKMLLYPPFCRLFCIGLSGLDEQLTETAAQTVMGELQRLLREQYTDIPVRLLGLSQCAVYRVAGKYRYQILVKVKQSKRTRQLFSTLLAWCGKAAPVGVSVYIDPFA
ncbi:MAG: primosomal protein N' [Angelakisella sp.]